MKKTIATIACFSFLVGCGSTQSGPGASGSGSGSSEAAWADMSFGAKKKHMKKVVLPKMKALFAEAPNAEDDVTCSFCHGEDPGDREFKMPNPDLPKLDFESGEPMSKAPKTAEFMKNRVVPEMAAALGVEPYNPETHQGFGCLNCHTQK